MLQFWNNFEQPINKPSKTIKQWPTMSDEWNNIKSYQATFKKLPTNCNTWMKEAIRAVNTIPNKHQHDIKYLSKRWRKKISNTYLKQPINSKTSIKTTKQLSDIYRTHIKTLSKADKTTLNGYSKFNIKLSTNYDTTLKKLWERSGKLSKRYQKRWRSIKRRSKN